MNVVIIDGDVSYPPTSGKRLRTLHLMQRLASRHHITYMARGQGDREQNQLATEYLSGKGIEVKIIDDPIPRKKGIAFYARLVANLFSPLPYSVASHDSEKLKAAVAEHAAQHRVDLYQLEWLGYRYALPASAQAVVLQAPNVESLIWQRYYENETRWIKRLYIREQWRKYLRCERDAFRAVRHIVAVTVEDAALAREWFGVDDIDVVDNGVDVPSFREVRLDVHSRCILYLGALDWRPNFDALEVLLGTIYPTVRGVIPDARLLIVGRSPPESLCKQVATQPGAELHADVPDVRPFLARSAVMAVPLRIGGGSRLKILESLAAGLPVVSTRVGAEGLCLRPGDDYTLANTPDEMSRALVWALTQREKARLQAEHGRATVTNRYDWSLLAQRLERVWEKAVHEPRPNAPRSNEPRTQ
jgi:glycosyltransferase involved in cell wall biosynthesis